MLSLGLDDVLIPLRLRYVCHLYLLSTSSILFNTVVSVCDTSEAACLVSQAAVRLPLHLRLYVMSAVPFESLIRKNTYG